MGRGNIDNLIPKTKDQSREEAKINGRKGGKASGIARREKKTMLETMEKILAMPIRDGQLADIDKIKSLSDTNGKNISVQEAIILAQVSRALHGDAKSAKLVMGILAEKQEKNEEQNGVQIIDDY